jgi:hypothetical protein
VLLLFGLACIPAAAVADAVLLIPLTWQVHMDVHALLYTIHLHDMHLMPRHLQAGAAAAGPNDFLGMGLVVAEVMAKS